MSRERERESNSLKNKKVAHKQGNVLKRKKRLVVNSAIFTIVFACVIAIVVGAINSKNTNIKTASTEQTETMQEQEDQSMPKALTEIKAREPNTDNFTYVTSEDGIQVPVPKGYVASTDAEERYVNGVTTDGVREHHGGFVIYEKNEGETDEQATIEIEVDIGRVQRERNQWVWVPISNEEVRNMYHTTNSQLYGNQYNFTSSGYSLIKNASLEPVLTTNDTDNINFKKYMHGISRNEFLQEMREDFHSMLENIVTYGGFYIGRYETGNINQKIPVVVRGNSNISNVDWYTMYKGGQNIKNGNSSVQTGLIWNVQWDETLKWLIDSKEKTHSEIGGNSASWGNIRSGNIKATGYSETWKANNIYDLAGNLIEYNMAKKSEDMRACRGGSFDSWTGRYYYTVASMDNGTPNANYIRQQGGSRLALYII